MKRIYVHGLGQTPASWEKTLARLDDGCEAICPALAELTAGGTVDYDHLYRAFARRCNQTDGLIDLCGLSLGGVLALNYALDYPQKVHSLALIAAQYKMPKGLLQFQNLLFRFMPRTMFDGTGFGKKDFLRLCASMLELDFSASLCKASCPTLIICGEKDGANKKASQMLAAALPQAELRTAAGSGHEVNQDVPEKLAQLLRDFYARIG